MPEGKQKGKIAKGNQTQHLNNHKFNRPMFQFEICVTNLASVIAAHRAGADRVELCAALDVGGVTPSIGLVRAAVRVGIPVYVLIRVREGDFCYSDAEVGIMLDDIRACREAGAKGVVIGALQRDGQLHLLQLRAMREAAGPMEVTCHRAFDSTPDPLAALDQLAELGIRRVLSSGQAETAYAGRWLLQKLVEYAAGRVAVMPGAGISAANIREIAEVSGAQEFHFTGKKKVVQAMEGGLPGLETWWWESDAGMIGGVMAALTPAPS